MVADTKHWGADFFGIAGDESVRLFMATVSTPGGDHTFFVVLDTPSSAELVRFSSEAQPIIDSLALPQVFIDN